MERQSLPAQDDAAGEMSAFDHESKFDTYAG